MLFLGIIGAVFAVFFMAVLYEGLKTLREYLVYRDWRHWKDHTSRHECSLRPIHDDDDDDTDRGTLIPSQRRQHKNKDKGYVCVTSTERMLTICCGT